MKRLQVTKQFKKDVNRVKNQRKDIDKLKAIIDALFYGKELDAKYRDHKLTGNYDKARECYLESDWLLLYESSEYFIKLRRTGSHAELLKL